MRCIALWVEIVARWNSEVARVLQTQEMKGRLADEGLEFTGDRPEQFLNTIKDEVKKWKRVVKEMKITAAG
ncbi:MAG: hypothetical protein A3G24_23245 [Betaproteobacteria bacterium RIFCSPLOWO2_12_FULL_62_13]|nr:MAG: hypothetical protein A3G24_23245 [Betaproteobacteria bacterium RIFCSPLOWO2_12_FULL_62_13]